MDQLSPQHLKRCLLTVKLEKLTQFKRRKELNTIYGRIANSTKDVWSAMLSPKLMVERITVAAVISSGATCAIMITSVS